MGARRFVAIGNLLGYQTKSLFPHHAGPQLREDDAAGAAGGTFAIT
jgi:hypothetical protein